jgi:cytochrome c1
MKNKVKIITMVAGLTIAVSSVLFMNGCAVPESIANKTGAQLWAENCNRCHNAPDPHNFSDEQWDAALEHMHQKAILTDTEAKKILAFMKSAD